MIYVSCYIYGCLQHYDCLTVATLRTLCSKKYTETLLKTNEIIMWLQKFIKTTSLKFQISLQFWSIKKELHEQQRQTEIFSLLFRYNPLPIVFELSFFVQLIQNTDHSMKLFDIIYCLQLTCCADLHSLQLTFCEILHYLQFTLCDVLNSSADSL